jgi:hypothetical protein
MGRQRLHIKLAPELARIALLIGLNLDLQVAQIMLSLVKEALAVRG